MAQHLAPRTSHRRNQLTASYNQPVHFAYMVRCADGTLYSGYARDPHEREKAHNTGRGAHYTACRRPVRLVYFAAFETRGDALRREHGLKRLSRPQKQALIEDGGCASSGSRVDV